MDGLHSHLWRRSDDAGEALPQTEVSPSMCKANKQEKTTKPVSVFFQSIIAVFLQKHLHAQKIVIKGTALQESFVKDKEPWVKYPLKL